MRKLAMQRQQGPEGAALETTGMVQRSSVDEIVQDDVEGATGKQCCHRCHRRPPIFYTFLQQVCTAAGVIDVQIPQDFTVPDSCADLVDQVRLRVSCMCDTLGCSHRMKYNGSRA